MKKLALAIIIAAVSTLSAAQSVPPNGRLLASNCFQCHGTNGKGGFEEINGKSSTEIYKKMKEFASGKEDKGSLMAAHSLGYTDAQLRALSAWLATVK